ncbi:thioredoxin domain-containing protein [Anabaena sp. FACHB-1237]|uniref:thioredoxin domain-containing protein n=1 Tax=Anabaena sp. FACHB-1237 TaxID=2692769 RepID=UPI0016818761|nr:thioredoxin domain-containing protein [Anabaena sp. FACHB-1237]MBD2139189.1 thioredoxin domain-containing protein [Anabaena sp. FACHB-1237]
MLKKTRKITKVTILTIISLCCFLVSWTLPVYADTNDRKISPQLEQQVLEIIRKNPEVIIETLQSYQEKQKLEIKKSRDEFIREFRNNPQAIIAKSPTIGANNSKIVLIEFSDFECPYCAEAHNTLQDLLKTYPNKFTLVYKHFPLFQIHEQALPAAQAAWAAYKQGKFWEYHNALFANQKRLGDGLYLEIAKNLNLDLVKFNSDRKSANTAIQQDLLLVDKLRLSGTPSFVITSPSYSGLIQLTDVEEILKGDGNGQ